MKRPWNFIDTPVFSLATYDADLVTNMNICTYVSAVSMQPKQYMVAVYHHTQTFRNIAQNDMAVLQLLHASQYFLIKKLGQTSGLSFSKEDYLHKKSLLDSWKNYKVLKNVSARLLLHKTNQVAGGDHDIFLFSVIAYQVFNYDYLHLDTLKDKKLIRL